MLQILTVITPLFLIILAAALLQKFKNVGDDWSTVLNEFALKIGLPVLIFSSLAKTPLSFFDQAQLITSNSIFLLVCFLAAYIIGKVLRLSKKMIRTLYICLGFGSIAYLGIPILVQLSGEQILPIASLIVAIYLFWVFTVGIGFLDYSVVKNKRDIYKKILKNLFKNPLLIAVILGLFVGGFQITLPVILLKSLDMVTASVTPTVLIVIGLFIGKSKIGKLSDWLPILLFSTARLVLLPLVFYFALRFFGFVPKQFSISIIEAAMPLAITPFALADEFDLDKNFISRSIVLSTILSILTLPAWISILSTY